MIKLASSPWLMSGLVLGGLGLLCALGWSFFRAPITASERYTLRMENIELVPPRPSWIHANIKADVLQSASLDAPISILDEDLTRKLYHAFPLHPWVADVVKVTKQYPARVTVELMYRRPVGMVEVPGGLFAIDAEGVLLPSGDFSPNQAKTYPRLTGITTVPISQVGTAWGDPLVEGGALVAASLLEIWNPLQLGQIVPAEGLGNSPGSSPSYVVHTRGGSTIHWGAANGSGPLSNRNKAERIKEIAHQQGGLEPNHQPTVIDLRVLDAIVAPPRTALMPELIPGK